MVTVLENLHNPFRVKLAKALVQLFKVEKEIALRDETDVPGTFITGRSGVPASRYQRLDRQLDRRISLAVIFCETQARVDHLRWQADAYDAGRIHRNGRPVRERKRVKNPWSQERKDRAALLRKAMTELSIEGQFTLPNGDTLHMRCVGFRSDYYPKTGANRKDYNPLAVVVVNRGGVWFASFLAKSIQGVDFDAMALSVVKMSLAGAF